MDPIRLHQTLVMTIEDFPCFAFFYPWSLTAPFFSFNSSPNTPVFWVYFFTPALYFLHPRFPPLFSFLLTPHSSPIVYPLCPALQLMPQTLSDAPFLPFSLPPPIPPFGHRNTLNTILQVFFPPLDKRLTSSRISTVDIFFDSNSKSPSS